MSAIVGIDIGRLMDHTAVCVMKGWDVVLVEQFPLNLTFAEINTQLNEYCIRADKVYVDASGVGDPVVERLRDDHGGKVIGIRITGGENARTGGTTWKVAKSMLVKMTMDSLGRGKVKIACPDPGRSQLKHELMNFRELRGKRTPKWEAELGDHDDLVLSLMLAIAGRILG